MYTVYTYMNHNNKNFQMSKCSPPRPPRRQTRQISMFVVSWDRDLSDGARTKSICEIFSQVLSRKLLKSFKL